MEHMFVSLSEPVPHKDILTVISQTEVLFQSCYSLVWKYVSTLTLILSFVYKR